VCDADDWEIFAHSKGARRRAVFTDAFSTQVRARPPAPIAAIEARDHRRRCQRGDVQAWKNIRERDVPGCHETSRVSECAFGHFAV
jgi:hypothetical protein